jgi:ribosomal protein L24
MDATIQAHPLEMANLRVFTKNKSSPTNVSYTCHSSGMQNSWMLPLSLLNAPSPGVSKEEINASRVNQSRKIHS